MSVPRQSRGPDPALCSLAPGRVCLIKPSALGDVVNAFPTLAAFRARWPSARITWVINRSLLGLVEGHPDIDDVIAYDRARPGLGRFARLLRDLRRRRFDLAVDLQGLLRSGLMAAATGSAVRVGLSDAREGAAWFYTHRVVPPGSRGAAQAVDRLLAVAEAFGADVSDPRPTLAVTEADRAWARDALSGVPRPRLGVNLGARAWETKRWPPAHFAEIARRAVGARGAGIVAVGAPEDRRFVDEFLGRMAPTPVADFCGRTSLPRLAALAGEIDVLVSNDTGPLHLAAAAGSRVVGIYTCTNPRANGPYGPLSVAVASGVHCAGGYHVRCPHRLECMDELGPDRVWPAVLAQLDACRNTTAA